MMWWFPTKNMRNPYRNGGSRWKIDYAVIGVGINVNIREFPAEMEDKATSLYLEVEESLTEARFRDL